MSASAAIRVNVLEGNYARMTELGLPLSLAVELQSRNLCLASSLWTAHSSSGGYSVSFFWPSLPGKRRCRRRRRKPPNNHPATSTTNLLSTNLPLESHLSNTSGPAPGNSEAKFVPLIPSNAHLERKLGHPQTQLLHWPKNLLLLILLSWMSLVLETKTPMTLLNQILLVTLQTVTRSNVLISRLALMWSMKNMDVCMEW